MRRLSALIVIILAAGLIFPTVYKDGRPKVETAHASPTLSGATPVDIINGDFSGTGLGEVGTPPANSGLETAGGVVGTPPTNYDFETGNFNNWTTTGSPTVNSGGPDGYYAQFASGQKALSSEPFEHAGGTSL